MEIQETWVLFQFFLESSTNYFPLLELIFLFIKLTVKKYKVVFKFIFIIPSLHFEWQRLHVTIK